MEKRSNHWADVLIWLDKVVDSCKTRQQVRSCKRLVRNFQRQYEDRLGFGVCHELTRKMELKLNDMYFESLNKKIDNGSNIC